MATYRKKAVCITAEHWDGTPAEAAKISYWVNMQGGALTIASDHLLIDTLEGEMRVSPGDYVLRGIAGEFYPCKPDIFEDLYDRVFY